MRRIGSPGIRFPPCRHCPGANGLQGSGHRWVRVIDCYQPQSICGHFMHHELRRCPWCRGSGRADIFTALYRLLRRWYLARRQIRSMMKGVR